MRGYVEVLEELGIKYRTEGHHHCRPGWVQTDCPNCSKGWDHFRAGFNLKSRSMSCWACGKLKVIPSIADLADVTTSEVLKLLGGQWFDSVERKDDDDDHRGKLVLPEGLTPLWKAHKLFLKERKLKRSCVEKYALQGIGPYTFLRWRVYIPIVHKGKQVSWTTRTIVKDNELRYWSAKPEQEIYPHRKVIFGADNANNTIIVTEDPFDVMRGGEGFGATFGTAITKAQVLTISKFPVRVICLDNDRAGRRASAELANELSAFPGITYRVTLDSKDVSSASREEIEELRSKFLSE